jgi:hypothetical protein
MRNQVVLALIVLFSAQVRAQEAPRTDLVPQVLAEQGVGISMATTVRQRQGRDAPGGGHLDALQAKLVAFEERFEGDTRLGRGATAIELGAALAGAVRGGRSMTGVSTQALRLGLRRPLNAIRDRAGLTVEPVVGHRTVAVTVSHIFP